MLWMRFVFSALASGVLLAQTPPPAQPRPSPAPSYARAAQLPARIRKFTATPDSIKPGQSVILSWAVENPTSVTIDHIGKVRPRGSTALFPMATTTYMLVVKGPNDQTLTQSVTVTVPGTAETKILPTSRSAPNETPRMPDGKPNLTGVYNSSFGRDPIQATLKPGAEKYKVVR